MSQEEASGFEKRLSGLPVCDLFPAELRGQDLFLISRRGALGLESRSCSYDVLSSQLSSELLAGLSVGSMAFQNKWKYAVAGHNHDGRYSMLSVAYTAPSAEGRVLVATISVDGAGGGLYDVYAPKVQAMAETVPEVGTLKFVYSSKTMGRVTENDLQSDDWDGWAYPDGSEYEVDPNRFGSALAVYGVGSNRIRLPDFSDFFEATPHRTSDCRQVLPQQVGVAEHSHEISSLKVDGVLSVKSDLVLSTYVNSTGGDNAEFLNNGNVHRGTDTTTAIGVVDFKFDLGQVQFKDLSCGDCEGCLPPEQGEFRPRNVRLPTMIYIGGVR